MDFYSQHFNMANRLFQNQGNGMPTDLYDRKDAYLIKIDMPGFEKENISIHYENNYLTVEANGLPYEEDPNYAYRERNSGSMRRQYYLTDVLEDGMKATYDNGVLTIELKKRTAEERTKTIVID